MPKVSVLMLAWNHENFVGQAIENIMAQQTNFDFDLIIGEDFSHDKTRQVCLEYKKKYPNRITLLFRDKHLGGGGQPNFIECYNLTKKATYVAHCEADDYWTSPNKLQKQVDFLDANPEFAICFHNTEVMFEPPHPYVQNYQLNANIKKDVFTIDDLVGEDEIWFMGTATIMYRPYLQLLPNLPDWFIKCKSGDIPLYILLARYGKIKYLNELMAVYRKHPGGLSLTDHKDDEVFLRNRIFMYNMIDMETGYKYHDRVRRNIARYYKMMLGSKQFEGKYFKQLLYSFKYFWLARPASPQNTKEVIRDHMIPPFLLNFSRYIKKMVGIIPS